MRKTLFLFIVFLAGGVLYSVRGMAFPVDDGFSAAKTLSTRYFTVSIAPGVDEGSLVSTLNIGPEHKVLAGQSLAGTSFSPENLGDLLDAFFLWASNVLDMQLYTYKGHIKIVRDEAEAVAIYRRLYGQDGYSEKGFYIFDTNTLYIAAPNFTKEILGHELGRVIISNFFVVQPPAKVQEVLAGSIEYQLRKTGSGR